LRDSTNTPRSLPGLQIIKPGRSELVHRVYSPAAGRYVMSFGVLVPFTLQAPGQEADIEFTSIWEHAASVLPEGDILDEGWPKPMGEFLAAGHCYPPAGHTDQPVSAHIAIGPLSKRLAVFGHRRFHVSGGITAAEPFSRMPITHANAFGGAGHDFNPDGKGMPGQNDTSELPNIELPDHLMMSHADRPPVAGFGPLPAAWPERARHLGKQDQHWRDTRWPHLPEDSDARYFMAAPPDQQLRGFWEGGEAILVQNMHPVHPELQGKIPRSRPRFFVHQTQADGQARFGELNVEVDTLWLLPEERLGIMIFRASISVTDPDGRDINVFFAEFENPAEPPLPVEAYLNSCLKTLSPELFKDVPDIMSPEFRASMEALNDSEMLEKVREQRDAFEATLQQAGLNEEQLLETLQANPHTRQLAQAILQRNPSLSGFFDEIESLVKFMQEETATGRETSAPSQPDLQAALTPYPTPAAYAVRAAPQGDTVEPLHDSAAAARHRQHVLSLIASGQTCANKDLSHANLAGLDLSGQDFNGAILAGANLAGAALQGANLANVYAVGARFDAANMAGCQLAGASLAEASFVGATLQGANLEASDCSQANFSGADLSAASLKAAMLSEAWLQGIRAERLVASSARFDRANLDHARLPAAQLDDADLSGASARGINLEEATAPRLNLSQADLTGANLTRARLDNSQTGPGTSLEKACLDSAILEAAGWMGANLREASMLAVQARDADFSDTDLSLARLSKSDLRTCSFDRAILEGADLSKSNLMQASFVHSNLQHCGFEHCNLYNATIKEPQLAGARFDHANLDLTLLATQ